MNDLRGERSSSPERSLWMILGERSVRRIVREICPESTPTVAARSLMLENFPSSIIFCHYHDHASNVIVLSRRSCSCRETREKKSSPVSFSIASTVTAKSCRGRDRINRDSEILQRTGASAIWNDKTDHFLRRSQVIDNLVVAIGNRDFVVSDRDAFLFRQNRSGHNHDLAFLKCKFSHLFFQTFPTRLSPRPQRATTTIS